MPSCYLESPASHLVVQNCDDRYISEIWISQMTYRSFFEVQPVFVGLHARLPQRMLQVVVKDWVQRLRLLDEAAEQSEVVHLELGARQWVAWLCIIIKTMVLVITIFEVVFQVRSGFVHGFEGARADAHGSTGWVRLKLPTALGCFGSGDDSCVCAFTSAHGYGGAPLAGGWRGGRRLLLLLRLVPAALRQRCFKSPLPAARAARRSRRRRQRLTILAPYNGEPWRIDGSVERARTPLAASTTNSQCTPTPRPPLAPRCVCGAHVDQRTDSRPKRQSAMAVVCPTDA